MCEPSNIESQEKLHLVKDTLFYGRNNERTRVRILNIPTPAAVPENNLGHSPK